MSEYEYDMPSLFAENTSPEDVSAAGGEPPRYPHCIPTLSVALNDVPGKHPTVTPEAYAEKGMSLMFPTLKPTTGGGLIEIKYLNRWTKKSGGSGHRSVTTQRGYKGFAGKQITFTAVFDDVLPPDNVRPYYTYEIIELLRLWAITEVTQRIGPTAYVGAILQIKKYVGPEEQAKIVKAFKDSFEPKGEAAFKKQYGAYAEKGGQHTFRMGPDRPFNIDPVPPAPLRFQFGNLVLPRCVITQADVTVTRYDGQRAIAAEVKTVLQEMTRHSLWSVDAPNPQKLEALAVGVAPQPEPPSPPQRSWWPRLDPSAFARR